MKIASKKISFEFVICLLFSLIVTGASLTFLFFFPKFSTKDYVDTTCIKIEDDWMYIDENGREHPVLKNEVDVDSGVTVKYKNYLPNVKNGYVVAFMSSRNISVYIDGKFRDELIIDTYPFKGGAVKNQYFFVELSAEDSGKELIVDKHSSDRFNGYVSATYVGTSWGIVLNILSSIGNLFILNFLFVILAFICTLGGAVYKIIYKKSLSFTQLVLALFFVGGWLTFDSEAFQFIFGTRILDGLMSYIFALCVPFPIMMYLNRITGKRYSRHFVILETVTLVNLLFYSFLHFSDIRYFGGNLALIDISISVIIGIGLIILMCDFFAKKNQDYKYFMVGIFVFSLFGIVEMISINVNNQVVDGYFVVCGLYFLIIMAIIQQVEELNRMEADKAKALEANESKSRFLASMSHELRTPINSIIGMDELIIRECKEPKVLEYASYIKSASNNLLGIVNDILDFSKIEAGKMDLIETEYLVADVMSELSILLRERAIDKGLQAKINISNQLPRVLYGDALHVKQIIINIISNAIKYTKSGTVSFFVKAEENDIKDVCVLKIIVSDTGIGIKQESIPKLFDYYSRLDVVKNHDIEGTGLGLNIVKQLLDSMNGSIKVESDYGFGSTFTVFIPQKVIDSTPIGNIDNTKPNAHKNNYKELFRAEDANILVVDDNNINLLIVKKLLENTLVNVEAVESGHEALRLAANFKYDLILMDHMMPQMDGIEALHKLRSDEKSLSRDTKVIVLTANAVSGMKEMYLNEGFCDYISKPIDPKLLEECIAKWLPSEKVQKEII